MPGADRQFGLVAAAHGLLEIGRQLQGLIARVVELAQDGDGAGLVAVVETLQRRQALRGFGDVADHAAERLDLLGVEAVAGRQFADELLLLGHQPRVIRLTGPDLLAQHLDLSALGGETGVRRALGRRLGCGGREQRRDDLGVGVDRRRGRGRR